MSVHRSHQHTSHSSSSTRSKVGHSHNSLEPGHKSGSRSKGPSLDRQITVQDVECLREAFALFDPDKKDTITPEKLGKVGLQKMYFQKQRIVNKINYL